jgi:MFS family permease
MQQSIRLGLKENKWQFFLLVVVNAFVGGMIGLERTLLPQLAEDTFHIAAHTAILSFILVFGLTKAITNYLTGKLANQLGRRNLLILGWIVGVPVPLLLMYAPHWNWIVAANVLLGINQGLAWSSTVVMKIDLVGEKKRGFAMGLNEFSGYLAVAIVAFLTGYLASHYGLRPYPFAIGLILAMAGLLISIFLIKDTRHHVTLESSQSQTPRLRQIFLDTTWRNRQLGSVTQAGLVNNLNDGMVWGLLPILLTEKGFSLAEMGMITAVYPAVWGISQLFTGSMADRFCKKKLLFGGMLLQAIALSGLIWASSRMDFILISMLLGWGTAMVYPTFLATIAEHTHPADRPESMGIFRLWRDLGYAIGALLTGVLADAFNLQTAILSIALLTLISAVIIHWRMQCRVPGLPVITK